eukprot:g83370.t1
MAKSEMIGLASMFEFKINLCLKLFEHRLWAAGTAVQDGDSRALADALVRPCRKPEPDQECRPVLCCYPTLASASPSGAHTVSRRCGLQALQIPRYSYSFHRMVRALSLALLNLGYG